MKSDDVSDWPLPNKIPSCATVHNLRDTCLKTSNNSGELIPITCKAVHLHKARARQKLPGVIA